MVSQSLSLAEEHPLILGAVVARAQVVLGGVAVDLVVDEEVDLVVPNRSGRTCDALRSYHVDPWRDEQLGAGRVVGLTTVLRLRNHGVRPPKAKKTLRNRGHGPPFLFS